MKNLRAKFMRAAHNAAYFAGLTPFKKEADGSLRTSYIQRSYFTNSPAGYEQGENIHFQIKPAGYGKFDVLRHQQQFSYDASNPSDKTPSKYSPKIELRYRAPSLEEAKSCCKKLFERTHDSMENEKSAALQGIEISKRDGFKKQSSRSWLPVFST